MDDYRLTAAQLVTLKALHKTLREKRLAYRVHAVILLGSGWTPQQVAEALFLDEKTVRSYFAHYTNAGEKGLVQLNYQGKLPSLTPTQQDELAKHLDENIYLSSGDIRRYVEKTYHVKYSPTGMKELLHRLHFSYKKPKHVPGKLDPAKQEAFLDEYEKLRKTKGENDPIYFGDGCHPQFNSIPAYGWIRCGVEKELKSNCGRERVNINGAVDIDTLETVTDFADSVNSQSTLRLFAKMEAKHPHAQVIHLIVDNATYYKSQLVKEYLHGSRIVLHYLPGYSPNLNLIERLWKFFKKKILYNKYYEEYEDFLSACKGFFRCRTKYREELRAVLTENFHRYPNNWPEFQNGYGIIPQNYRGSIERLLCLKHPFFFFSFF
jgi:transposase